MGVQSDLKRLTDMYVARMQDHYCDSFVLAMDQAEVANAVLLLPDFTFALPGSELNIEEMLDEHCKILARHPGRFRLLFGVDPRWGNDGLALFEKAVLEKKCDGLKLYPPCGYSPSAELLYPFYEICRAHRLPVLTHTGPTAPCLLFNEAHPMMVDQAARDFPDVNFILAHGGVNFINEAVTMVKYRPNVYLDISGYPTIGNPSQVQYSLRSLFACGINHKIIYGSDWPVFQMRGTYTDVVTMVTASHGPLEGVEDDQKAMILHKNVLRILPPPTQNHE